MVEMEEWGMSDGVRCDPGPVKGVQGEDELDRQRIITICYTSGTTGSHRFSQASSADYQGDPKGVVLTNSNMTTAVISNTLGSTGSLVEMKEWRFFSYLPLSHMQVVSACSLAERLTSSYERFLELVVMYADGVIGFSTGDVTRLLEDAQIIKPHLMAGVPRVWNR